MKTKEDKSVNRKIRSLNKKLQRDVVGTRFSVRQIKKNGLSPDRSYHYYLYEFCDEKKPYRNFCVWLSESEIIICNKAAVIMNYFIISSDFWVTFTQKDNRSASGIQLENTDEKK